MKKILILQDDFPPKSFGGAGIVAFSQAKALRDKGHDVSVITAVQDKADVGESEYEGLKIFSIYSKYHIRWQAYISLYNPRTLTKIRRIIAEIKPDIVHAHNIHRHLSYHSLKLAKESGAKVFLTAHDAMSYHYGKADDDRKISPWAQMRKYRLRYNPFRNLIIRHYLGYVDKIFVVSHALERALNNNGIINTIVIHNGIDVNEWQASNLSGKKLILFGGRISEAKGSGVALRALELVRQKIPEAELVVVGRTQLSGAKNLGWLSGEELKAAYASSDLVITPSLYLDPFPTVNLEAMASKKPVIATSLGGSKEAVLDSVTGYIVDPLNVELFAEKIIELLLDPIKAKQFGEAGYERVKKEFNLEKVTEKILAFYDAV